MSAIRIEKILEKDGEIVLTGLPFRKGEHVELTVTTEPTQTAAPATIKASALLHSKLIGLWKDRTDITDSAAFARELREQAQRRQR